MTKRERKEKQSKVKYCVREKEENMEVKQKCSYNIYIHPFFTLTSFIGCNIRKFRIGIGGGGGYLLWTNHAFIS